MKRRFGRFASLLSMTTLTLLGGCSDALMDGQPAAAVSEAKFRRAIANPAEEGFVTRPMAVMAPIADAAADLNKSVPAAEDVPKSPTAQRKIVYNATISLVAESIGGISTTINDMVKAVGGYISDTDESSDPSQQKRATWTARIPVEAFDAFVGKVGKLGELQQSKINSQDVTEEYVDLEARIKNKTEEERRLLKHLADSTGKLEEILQVEREISRVRGEVERIEGRLRYLGNVASLSTVTITVTEIKDYVPPVVPTFATQIGRTFSESSQSMVDFGKDIILGLVAIAPWVPFIVIGGLFSAWLGLKIWKNRHLNLFRPSTPSA